MTRTTERDMLKNTWSKYDCTFSTKSAKWYNIMFINIFFQYSFVIQKFQNYNNFEFLWITKLFINKRPKGHTAYLATIAVTDQVSFMESNIKHLDNLIQ